MRNEPSINSVAVQATPEKWMQTGEKKFAGKALKTLGSAATGAFAVFDIMSLMNRDKQGKEEARKIAERLVNAGYTDYDAVMNLAQNNGQLESQIGDIGASDYAKTIAGIGLQAGDIFTGGPLAAISAPIGAIAQIDLQMKKGGRNKAFKEAFEQQLMQRGLG